ncbi:MAG: HNH endonuclease [Myxococcales bacterium]|nr:HNH endonuclease [Myxococcales bacterium]
MVARRAKNNWHLLQTLPCTQSSICQHQALETSLDPRDPNLTAKDVDATLRRLARESSRHEHTVMQWLLRADELQVERLFGYASIREYGERVFGWTGRGVEDRLRVARALEHLPRLSEAFARGDLVYSVVRELCRIATPDTEEAWIREVEGKRAREVQRQVAARSVGDRPSDPADETRRQVLARHGGRCAVPGCANGVFAQVHHVVPRADGGNHDHDGLIPLCDAHHAAVHDGALVVTGTFTEGFAFEHADGRAYGSPHACASKVEVIAEAFAALRGLGFRETETRQMLDRVRRELADDADLAAVVRRALQRVDVGCGLVREAVVPYLRAV